MGCDIHLIAQKKVVVDQDAPAWAEQTASYQDVEGDFLDYRSYRLFGFLADVRNYSAITPIAKRRGIPDDFHDKEHPYRADDYYSDYHSHSWLSLEELLGYDYDQTVEDRRVTIDNDGGRTAEPGGGENMTLREFLGEHYFSELERMKAAGVDRIVFCFDN